MADRDAFLRTIRENPHDDGPRLVFADWLEEQGECDYAELIRTMCERARLVSSGTDEATKRKMAEREDKLRDANPNRVEMPELAGVVWGPFHRGFISTVRAVSAAAFLRERRGSSNWPRSPASGSICWTSRVRFRWPNRRGSRGCRS